MAAVGKTPIQHFRSRTTGTVPITLDIPLAMSAAQNVSTLTFATASLAGNNVLNWAIDAPSTFIQRGTTITAVTTSGSNTIVTIVPATVASIPINQSIRLQNLREGELFVNTQDNRLMVGGYPQLAAGNSDIIGLIDMIPSIKTQAGRALRVSDDGLTIIWGNVTAAGGAVNAVWAGRQTNPITLTPNLGSGITTSPPTDYGSPVQLSTQVTAVSARLTDGTFDVTLTTTTPITVGNVLSDSTADFNLGNQARVNLVRSATVINVTSTTSSGTPWGSSTGVTGPNVIRFPLGGSGIQGTGFVGTDVQVLPYMQVRNRTGAYANFASATQDVGISSAGRNPNTYLSTTYFPPNTQANVVDLPQGGFGIALANRQELVNAAHPEQTTDTASYTAKTYVDWTNNGFGPYVDTGYFYRISGQNGGWPAWLGTNRQFLVNNGTNASWQVVPQPLQNNFYRLVSNEARVANKGIFTGAGRWLSMALNSPIDSVNGATTSDKISVRPDNQDLILDIIQDAPVPIASGGTGIDLRDSSDTYWDAGNNRLKENIAWSIPAYGTNYTGELNKITPPFLYTPNSNTDPSATTSYVLTYKDVQGLPTWSTSLQGFQLQGGALPATNTFTNSNRPLRLEGLGRFGVWNGVNSYDRYVADGIIQAPLQVVNQDLRLQGSTAATDSRLILQNVTSSPTTGQGLHSIRFDSGLTTVNSGQGTSFSQVAEDYVSLSSTSINTDFTNAAVVLANVKPNNGTSANIALNHASGAGRGSIAQFLAGGSKGISGVVFFTVPADANVAKLSITITTSGGLGTPVVLRPLAGIVAGQSVAISWWSNGVQCIITVAAGD